MAFPVQVTIDPATGQLLSVGDASAGFEMLRFEPGHEIAINGVPLGTRLVRSVEARAEHVTEMRAVIEGGYGAGAALFIRRVMVAGGVGLHTARPGSLHVRYEITRVSHADDAVPRLDYIWPPEIESPLRIERVTVLAAPTPRFGPATRMRAIAIGGSGPREHVSLEDGPVAEVVPFLQSPFRTAFPGQQTLNGAMYYADDDRWVWLIARRPTTSGRVLFTERSQAFAFDYHQPMSLQDELFTPAVSLFWGRGLESSEHTLAEQFDLYEEPPDWWYRTTWFWLHPGWNRRMNFDSAAEGARVMMDDCGINGFGVLMHDIPWCGNDIDVASHRPGPNMGGFAAMERLAKSIRDRGGHTFAWFTRMGHRPDSPGFDPRWAIRGIDGRPVRLRNSEGVGVTLDICNPADPGYRDYLKHWVEFYVKRLGITGLFWDSGFQPIPPDFGNKPYLRHPGQTGAMAADLYEDIYRFGRSLSDDFFMWCEGISVDHVMNGFAVDNRRHGIRSAHPLMHRIAHHGPGGKRIVWRSAWAHDLASGMPFCHPQNDVGWPGPEKYRQLADDPLNRWACAFVRQHGVRDAVGLCDGVSLLADHVVVCPGLIPAGGSIAVPGAALGGRTLEHTLDGRRFAPDSHGNYTLAAPGGYRLL